MRFWRAAHESMRVARARYPVYGNAASPVVPEEYPAAGAVTSARPRRARRYVVTASLLGLALLIAGTALASWSSSAPGPSASGAQSINPGNQPSANATGSSVTVSWSASTLSGGDPVDGYVVRRYDVNDVPFVVGANCDGTITALSCTETNLPDGTWTYSVTPVLNNWSGVESVKSNEVSTTAFSGIAPTGTGSGAVDGASLSWSHTVGAGSDRVLVVGVSMRKNDQSVTSITYGGVGGFTLAGGQNGPGTDHRVEIYYKLAPPEGTASVQVTFSGNVDAVGGSASFTGVHQTTPVGTFAGAQGESTSPSVNVSSAPGDVVVDVLSFNGDVGVVTAGSGQTQRWSNSSGTGDGDDFGAGSTKGGASSVTMSWTGATAEKWALGAVPLKPTAQVPPAAPSGLSATALSNSEIDLAWVDNSFNEAGFKIERSPGGAGSWSQIDTVGANVTTYRNSGLAASTAYDYRVRAHNTAGNSAYSNTASATTDPASSGQIAVGNTSSTAGTGASLSWSHTVGAGSDRVLVVGVSLRKNDKSVSSITYGGVGGFTSAGVQNGPGADHRVQLYYKLMPAIGTANIVVTLSGAEDATAGAVSLTGVHQTNPVGTFAGDQGDSTTPSVNVTSAPGELVVDVMSISGDVGALSVGSGQTQRWSNQSGTGDGNDRGAGSTEEGASSVTMSWTGTNSNKWAIGAVPLKPTVQVPPAAPSGLSATALSNSEIDLAWVDNSFNEAGFKIERSPGGAGSWSQIDTVGANVTTYRNSGLAASTAYDYRVRAHNTAGNSAYSNTASATTQPASSGIAVGNTSSAAGGTASLSWSHTVGAGSDRLLVVGVAVRKNDRSVSSITYGGVGGFTFAGFQHGPGADHRVELWYKLMPAIGTADIVVTLTGSEKAAAGAISFTGVHQTTPVGTFAGAQGDSTNPAVNVASATGEVVVDVVSIEGSHAGMTPGAGQTQRWSATTGTGGAEAFGAASTKAGASSVTMSWTAATAKKWAIGAIALKPA